MRHAVVLFHSLLSEVGPPVSWVLCALAIVWLFASVLLVVLSEFTRSRRLCLGPVRDIYMVCPYAVTPLIVRVAKWGFVCCLKTVNFRLEIFSICLLMTCVTTAIGFGWGPEVIGARGAV